MTFFINAVIYYKNVSTLLVPEKWLRSAFKQGHVGKGVIKLTCLQVVEELNYSNQSNFNGLICLKSK